MKNLIRALIAGMALPSLILPVVIYLAVDMGKSEILSVPFIHYIPILWGVWNMLYFMGVRKLLPAGESLRLFIYGAILGLIVAVIGVFVVDIASVVGMEQGMKYAPLVGAPIGYGIFWVLIVKYLNRLVGLVN